MQDRTALKVGIATFLMTIAIAVLLVWKSSIHLKATGYQLVGKFQYVSGLLNGAEVRYRGVNVGKVFSIKPKSSEILVYFRIKSDVSVPKDSVVRVKFDGLIGERFIAIIPNQDSKEIVKNGDVLEGSSSSGLADFIDVGTENLESMREIVNTFKRSIARPETEQVLEQVIRNIGVISEELAEITNSNQLQNMVKSFESFSQSLQEVVHRLNNEILTDEVAHNISYSAENFAQFSNKLNTFSDRIERFLLGDEETSPSSAMNLFKTVNTMKIKPGVMLQYTEKQKLSNYMVNMDWDFGKTFFRTSVGDRVNQESKLINFQYGFGIDSKHIGHQGSLVQSLSTRMGLFYTEPGLALDVKMLNRLLLEFEFYNFNQIQVDFTTKYRLGNDLSAVFNLRQNPLQHNQYDHLSLGLSYYY